MHLISSLSGATSLLHFFKDLVNGQNRFCLPCKEHQNQLYFQDAPNMLVVRSSGSLH